ncbi:MAG: UDP-glucose/GDP-mannose dehydrogenase family protein, partial [Halobacteriota archaeon]
RYAQPEATAYDALSNADALVLMTAHREFLGLDLDRIKAEMRTAIIVDGRRCFDPEIVEKLGIVYRGVGAKNG